jgi:hypothetical protein
MTSCQLLKAENLKVDIMKKIPTAYPKITKVQKKRTILRTSYNNDQIVGWDAQVSLYKLLQDCSKLAVILHI